MKMLEEKKEASKGTKVRKFGITSRTSCFLVDLTVEIKTHIH